MPQRHIHLYLRESGALNLDFLNSTVDETPPALENRSVINLQPLPLLQVRAASNDLASQTQRQRYFLRPHECLFDNRKSLLFLQTCSDYRPSHFVILPPSSTNILYLGVVISFREAQYSCFRMFLMLTYVYKKSSSNQGA